MGAIQGAVNNMLTGTAFLLGQSPAIKEWRDKRAYAKDYAERIQMQKEADAAERAGIVGAGPTPATPDELRKEGVKFEEGFDDVEAYNARRDELGEKHWQAIREFDAKANERMAKLMATSPDPKVRADAHRFLGYVAAGKAIDKLDQGPNVYDTMNEKLRAENEAKLRAEHNREHMLEMLRNPGYSTQDIKGAIKDGRT